MEASHTAQHFQFGALALCPEHEVFQNKVRIYLCQNLEGNGRLPLIIQLLCVAASARFLQPQLFLSRHSVQGNWPCQLLRDSDFPPFGVFPDTISETELLLCLVSEARLWLYQDFPSSRKTTNVPRFVQMWPLHSLAILLAVTPLQR